jgi:NADH-quinone oxidoreductase subunit J
MKEAMFFIFALTACVGAFAVLISQSVVRMAVWLIVSLGSVSGLFFLLHADFVAATQLLIYVGGTLVVLIFGVMLTASGPYLKINTSPGEGFLAGGVALLLLAMIVSTVYNVDWNRVNDRLASETGGPPVLAGYNEPEVGNTARPLGLSFLGFRFDGASSTGYLLPFEIVSVHLLVVLIAAAYLARAKRRVDRSERQ